MKVRYVGPNIGVTMLTDGVVYEVVDIEDGLLRVIDDDPDDDTGYLYDPVEPGSLDGTITGKFIIIEDDDSGILNQIIG